MFEQLEKAIALVANGDIGDREREAISDQILQTYSWSNVAKTTENLYLDVLLEKEKKKTSSESETANRARWEKNAKKRKTSKDDDTFADRVIEKCTHQGVVFGPLLCCVAALVKLYLKALELLDPEENIRERSTFIREKTLDSNRAVGISNGGRNGGIDSADDIGRFLTEKWKEEKKKKKK